MDKETVITHLQIISTWASFARERDLNFFTPKHLEDIAQWSKDAIRLLKRNEVVEPIHDGNGYYLCPSCGGYVAFPNGDCKKSFCDRCGKALKWETIGA